jgi:Protein of unknown function (DUF3891)
MLIRPEGEDVVAIGQASHAWVSGQLARAWGNERFDPPEPREEVCLAAEQHDVGMAEWDLAPEPHPDTGSPLSFMEMALHDHLRLWSAAPRKLLTQSRYAALLVSLQGSALYEHRNVSRMPAEGAAAVAAYLAEQRALQQRLADLLGADRDRLSRNQRLLAAWDALSLALCLGWDTYVARDVPASGVAEADLRLEPPASGPDGRFVLDPWPFAAGELTVRCEGRRLVGRHREPSALEHALAEAPHVPLAFTLRPA